MEKNNKIYARPISQTRLYRKVKFFLSQNKLLNKKMVVAVSAGLDSSVLYSVVCDVMLKEKKELPLALYVFHGQRSQDEENKDQEFLATLTGLYGQKLQSAKIKFKKESMSEASLRDSRQQVILDFCQSKEIDAVLTGHHLDDQIETFFLRLFSGAHINGLSGMKSRNTVGFYKPLLSVEKKELLQFARDKKILFRDDVTNLENDYTRNHIRNVFLPLIQAQYGNAYKNNIENLMDEYENQFLLNTKLALICLERSLLDKDVYDRAVLLHENSEILKRFFSLAFDRDFNRLNTDQLESMVVLLKKGSGRYMLQEKTVFFVSRKTVSFQRES